MVRCACDNWIYRLLLYCTMQDMWNQSQCCFHALESDKSQKVKDCWNRKCIGHN